MTRIYTKTGDDGTTGLIGGKRVSKDSLRVEACGSVDELNAALGVVRSYQLPAWAEKILQRVQDDLFTVGANLAVAEEDNPTRWNILPITEGNVGELEAAIDECESLLEPLQAFIIPGGTGPAATLHLARAAARRAERSCVALSHKEKVDLQIIRYLNRLSDLCFVLARLVNRQSARSESHPTFGKR